MIINLGDFSCIIFMFFKLPYSGDFFRKMPAMTCIKNNKKVQILEVYGVFNIIPVLDQTD